MKARDPSLLELSLTERGRMLAAWRLLGPVGAAMRCKSPAARHQLEVLANPDARAREEAALAATRPEHVDRIHPSWYESPPSTSSEPARRYLERSTFGRLVAMEAHGSPLATPRAVATIDQLMGGSTERLLLVLVALGRRRVAVAFTGAPRSALAQLLARIGEPEASALATEVRGIPPGVSAEEVKAAQRALFRTGPEPEAGETGSVFFQRVGCGWIAPVAGLYGDHARRLAQRLPRSLGEIVLRERQQAMSDAERAALLRLCQSLPLL